MAQITKYPVLHHLRSEPSRHVLHWSAGKLRHSGRGLAFWFQPLSSSVAEVPCDDRELPFLFHDRSLEFQDISVQGVITWRVAEPERLAERLDFSIDLRSGKWREKPLEQVSEILVHLAQQHARSAVVENDVRRLLESGAEAVRARISDGLAASQALDDMGLEVVAVSITKVAPSAELERALQTPAMEAFQQEADQASFARRALAVEKERAIAENELQNQIELAGRESKLIAQRGENEKSRAREESAAERILAEGSAERLQLEAEADAARSRLEADASANRTRVEADARAESIAAVEEARVVAERQRMEIYRDVESHVMMGLAAREFAGKLQRIEHLNLAPDMLGQLLANFVNLKLADEAS